MGYSPVKQAPNKSQNDFWLPVPGVKAVATAQRG